MINTGYAYEFNPNCNRYAIYVVILCEYRIGQTYESDTKITMQQY